MHPKLLPCCTVLVIDSLVKWSVGLWKGKEKGNGKRESRWKTTCHILQKWWMVQKESRLQWMNIETHKSEINKMLWLQCCFLFPGFLCCFLQCLTSPPPLPSLWFYIYFSSLSAYGYSLSFLCSSWISHIDTLLPFQPVLPLVCSSLCSFGSQRNLASPFFCSLHTPWRLSFLHHICIFSVIPGQTSQGQSHWLPRCLPFQTA